MRPDFVEPGDPQDWLQHAQSDLIVASQRTLPGVFLETLCFHAQQTVEKSIKAVLIYNNIEPPYTHNIATLINSLKQLNAGWPDELDTAIRLTRYAVQTRYPGVVDEVTEEDYQKALQIAKAVLDWAGSYIKK